MKKVLILLFILTLYISGCEINSFSKEGSNYSSMPIEMPSDFDFIVKFGVGKMNEINTYEHTVTKDLISDGTATTNSSFTTSEMADIYRKMKGINITEMEEFIPNRKCAQKPLSEDEWQITISGETITHHVSGEQYCQTTDEAKQLIELRNYVFTLVKNKEEYNKLPEANGGYE